MKIDKNITIPEREKYPISKMQIGDSLLDDGCRKTSESKIRLSAKKHGSKYGKKFSARKVDGGVRIWRIE